MLKIHLKSLVEKILGNTTLFLRADVQTWNCCIGKYVKETSS